VHVARTVRGEVIAQRVKILTAAFGDAFQRSLQAGQDFEVVSGRFHGGIDQSFRLQVQPARFPQEAKGETGDDSESFLAIDTALRKRHGNGFAARGHVLGDKEK